VPALSSESLVLRTYPFQEADLVVSFFTRDQGRLRGIARRAKRPKSPFGSGLERLSHVTMFYFQKETRELVNLDSCELIQSQFGLMSDYTAGVALDFMAEVTDQILPPAEPNERYFRLVLAVLDHMRAGGAGNSWRALAYFSLWAVRLSGFLPELRISGESKAIAEEMLRKPVSQVSGGEWTRETAADLRRFLIRRIEEQIERKLATVPVLEAL
jgi:DNA repair protein RecO (recombination protein O)